MAFTGLLNEPKVSLIPLARVDADEAPIAAAEVAAEFSAVGGIGGTPHPAATTGVNGRFRVRLPSRAKIWASKEGHGPSRLHEVAGDIEDLVLQLEAAGASIHGVVLDGCSAA